MAIEGPLRELGIHDVFQLLDLSRKTGALRISSELRDDQGLVYFDNGRVVHASIRSKAMPMELALLQAGRIAESDLQRARGRQEQGTANGRGTREIVQLLIEIGAITQKELERQLRLQIESVVFELMSWGEGFFSFEERLKEEMPRDTRITVSTESLLMEGARRIDEWSRIADTVPNVDVVPDLAPIDSGREGAMLDLLPHEWQVLTMIDGNRDLRGIAASLARDEFEIAKIAYGLATTGVITVRVPAHRRTPSMTTPDGAHAVASPEAGTDVFATRALADDVATARIALEQFLRATPAGGGIASLEARAALDALARLQRALEPHTGVLEGAAHD